MPGQEDVVRRRQREPIGERRVGRDGRRGLEALAVAAAQDVRGHRELIAAHPGLARHLVGMDVDHLDHPVGVAAARGGHEVRDRLAADLDGRGQHLGHEGQHVRPARGLALVVHEPQGPGQALVLVADGLDGPRAEGHRLGGVRHVLVEGRIASGGRGESRLEPRAQVQRGGLDRASAGAAGRPRRQAPPGVGARLERADGRDVAARRAVLEVPGQERGQDLAAEEEGGVAIEAQRAERAPVGDLLAVVPRAEHQEHAVVVRVLGLEGLVDGDGAVDVLLVPQAVHEHHRDTERPRAQQLVHGLVAPEGVVGRVLQDLAPEAHLLQAVAAPHLPRRAGGQPLVVVVEMARPPLRLGVARGLLLPDVGHVLLPEGTVVEPVVAHPSVHHRVHGHGDLQRRVRVDQGHQGQEPVVGDAEDADPSARLRHVLHQPVDGVVGVGGVVDGSRVERAVQRPVHHVVALGAVLAAHVLHHADVAALDDDVGGVVVALEDGPEVRALRVAGQLRRIVGGARQQDRRAAGALGDEDDGVELDPVAHGDHHVAPGVVEALRRRLQPGRGLAGQRGVLRRGRRGGLGGRGPGEGEGGEQGI